MVDCEACGAHVPADAIRCPGCGTAVAADTDPLAPPARFGSSHPEPDTWSAPPVDGQPHDGGTAPNPAEEPPEQDGPDFDPDETSRFLPSHGSRRSLKNNVALVGLAIALVAAVSSLAWLIGQAVGGGVGSGPQPTATATPTALSTRPPRGSVVCTTEVTRSDNTTCAVATKVLSAVRRLGTDLPPSFRVTIEHPETKKNVTYVCRIKSWITCTAKDDAVVYVMRQV